MKKLMNHPDRYVEDMLTGLCFAHPELDRTGPGGRVICRRTRAVAGPARVGIVSGGGSGHLPLFTGYVGQGWIDACAIGDVFAGPNLDSCMAAIEVADQGKGVLRLYGNYGGDRMNFDLAGEMLGLDDASLTTVLGTDDIASAPASQANRRRGVAGLVFAYKVAGASAERGDSLAEVTRMAQKAVDRTRTIGCATAPCQVPGAEAPTFTLADNEMELGIGIHGEPGISRGPLMAADDLADTLLDRVLQERPEQDHGNVAVLLNSLGATPLEELYILYARIQARLDTLGIEHVRPWIGQYATAMEMAGVSLSVLHLDPELEAAWSAPADCPFWRVP